MKSLVAFLALTFSINTFAYYEDVPEVKALGNSGHPIVEEEATACLADHEPGTTMLYMDGQWGKDGLCIDPIIMGKEAQYEVSDMHFEQYENESDYDARITNVMAFKHDGYLNPDRGIDPTLLEELQGAFHIPAEAIQNWSVGSIKNKKPLDHFSGYLSLGEVAAEIERFYLSDFLRKMLKDDTGIHLEFYQEIELYPGGGINARFHIFLMEGKALYVKEVYWNS